MKSKTVTIPIYEQRVLLITHSCEHSKVTRLIKNATGIDVDYDDLDYEAGSTQLIAVDKSVGNYNMVVVISDGNSKEEHLFNFSHELFHTTAVLCEYLGIDITESSGQEAGAYLQGWLFKIIYKFVT